MKSVLIEKINVYELQEMIKEIIKPFFDNLNIIQEKANKKDGIYGTRKEVAKELHISLPTLIGHTNSGILQGYKIGGRILYK